MIGVLRAATAAWRICILCILFGAAAACARPAPSAFGEEAYIWQRHWTPALTASIAAAQDHFNGWRVLALEAEKNGDLAATAPDFDVLKRSALPVILVVRLNGNRPPPAASLLAGRVAPMVAMWRAAGVVVSGVEIDHDCATAQLDRYPNLLADLRRALPPDVRLSITVLPTWIGSSALHDVLARVDSSVLQVHSILAPRADEPGRALFDTRQARHWIDAYAALSAKDFRVALPAYGLRVGFDDNDRAISAEAETPRDGDPGRTRELRVDPREVANLLRALQQDHPAHLGGVVWFRMPTNDDRRAWTLPTLLAVIDGAPLRAQVAARLVSGESGVSDLLLLNNGTLDSPAPQEIVVAANDCSAADALAGFSFERQAAGWRFFRTAEAGAGDVILRAGHKRQIGWLRCASIAGVSIHEFP